MQGRSLKLKTVKRPRRLQQAGQALVEFAFAIPFLLLCVVAVIYFGRAFYVSQILSYAAQEGARAASSMPNLNDPAVRDAVRGFTTSGDASNTNSVIYSILHDANLLSGGASVASGKLPPSAVVKILPWDGDGSAQDSVPAGTVAVRVDYPFSIVINPFTGQSATPVTSISIALTANPADRPVSFGDFRMSEKATVAQSIYQEVN